METQRGLHPAKLTRVDDVELRAFEAEVFFHPAGVCIVQVHAIKVVDPVHQTAKGQNNRVELHYELPLGFGLCRLAPDDSSKL